MEPAPAQRLRGAFDYRGVLAFQHADVGPRFAALIDAVRPARILEIGTAAGGLTLLLRDLLDAAGLPDCLIRTYDMADNPRPALEAAVAAGAQIDFRLENPFVYMYDALRAPEVFREFIGQPGTTVVLCDGGSKKNEFRLLAPLLKPGDVIMGHDYAPDAAYFEQHVAGRVWNWHELQDADVADAVRVCDLRPFMAQAFQEVVWLCKRRAPLAPAVAP